MNYIKSFAIVFLTGALWAADQPVPKTDTKVQAKTADTDAGAESPQIEVMDIPTADILDPATYAVNFRFYDQGGIASRLVIGPLKRVNLGVTFDGQNIIGSGDPHMVRPSIYFKLRAFDGTDVLPALALGYDSQAYLYNTATHDFLEKEKGFYFVGSHEIFLPDFELHAGMNVNSLDDTPTVYGFFGATYKIVSSFALLAEYDNIRNGLNNRVNLGGRYWITPYFNVDVGARNVGRGEARGGERIVRLNYTAHFPFEFMADDIVPLEFEKPIAELESKIQELKSCAASEHMDFSDEIRTLEEKCEQLKRQIYGALTPWQRVTIARHPQRPYTLDYIKALCTNFIELHGDRSFSDDASIVGGMAMFEGRPIVVIGHQKGRTVQESMRRNFGMPHPEGYRKALRLMKFAEKFKRPVLCFIDTPGAYPGIGAEERGQARAIAINLLEMAALKTPVVCAIIGEGGSGGALAIGIGDRILMCENAWYSVISPEGCAAILFRDASRAPEAAAALKLTAPELKTLGIVDEVISEPQGGAHRDIAATAQALKTAILTHLTQLEGLSKDQLMENRYQKFRVLGTWRDSEQAQVAATAPRRKAKGQKIGEPK